MKKLIILPILTAFLVSCANKKKDETSAELVTQPGVNTVPALAPALVFASPVAPTPAPTPAVASNRRRTVAPAPVPDANPTAAFRIPSKDTTLPTDEQLADGADSSIGTGAQKANKPSTQPSTSVKPPGKQP